MNKENPMRIVKLNCSICHKQLDEQINKGSSIVYWTEGHNARPVKKGRCCTDCNNTVVIPARIKLATN